MNSPNRSGFSGDEEEQDLNALEPHVQEFELTKYFKSSIQTASNTGVKLCDIPTNRKASKMNYSEHDAFYNACRNEARLIFQSGYENVSVDEWLENTRPSKISTEVDGIGWIEVRSPLKMRLLKSSEAAEASTLNSKLMTTNTRLQTLQKYEPISVLDAVEGCKDNDKLETESEGKCQLLDITSGLEAKKNNELVTTSNEFTASGRIDAGICDEDSEKQNHLIYEAKEREDFAELLADWEIFQATKMPLTQKIIQDLAIKHNDTAGKWMINVRRGYKTDLLWRRIVTNMVDKSLGDIATVAKVTPSCQLRDRPSIILIFHDHCDTNEKAFALERAIRAAGVKSSMFYKPNVFTHLGISTKNPWKLRACTYESSYNARTHQSSIVSLYPEH